MIVANFGSMSGRFGSVVAVPASSCISIGEPVLTSTISSLLVTVPVNTVCPSPLSLGVILGIAFGGAAFAALVVLIAVCVWRRSQARNDVKVNRELRAIDLPYNRML